MKKWNAPEMVELSIECTAGDGNFKKNGGGNTPTASEVNYKKKDNQCECKHNTNFQFLAEHNHGGSDSHVENDFS